MRLGKRLTAGGLAAAMLLVQMAEPVLAAAPKTEVDETLYVNMNHYGEVEKLSVVKGYLLNGAMEIEDYGDYEQITNMSNKLLPTKEEGKVTWKLEEAADSFFYQAALKKDAVQLPWDLDVTYKLNGRSVKPEELAGVSGMIGIHIHITPNELAKEYYKDNMILALIVPVDNSTCYSVDAAGAQFQSIGSMSAAVFSALPGEEKEFDVAIGSDDFSFAGVFGVMVAGTIDSLEYIQDLNEVKDTWKNEGDAMYNSLHELLLQLESTKGDLSHLQSGVNGLNAARAGFETSKGQLRSDAEQSLDALDALSEQIDFLIPHLETGKKLLEDVEASMDAVSDKLLEVQEDVDELSERMYQTQEHLEDLVELLEKHGPDTEKIRKKAQEAEECLKKLEELFQKVEQNYGGFEGELQGLLEAQEEYGEEALSASLLPTASMSDAEEAWESVQDSISEWKSDAARLEELTDLAKKLEEIWGAALQRGDAWLQESYRILDLLQDADAFAAEIRRAGKDGDRLLSRTRAILDDSSPVIDGLLNLSDSVKAYYPDMKQGLDDVKEMSVHLNGTLRSSNKLLRDTKTVLQTTGEQLNAAGKNSLDAASDVLGKSVGMAEQIGVVREAGEQLKSVIDEKTDKLEEESSVLKMDPEAEKISFTSDKNQEPRSIQIVVRTGEISEDDAVVDEADLESSSSEKGLTRMWKVLVRMWEAVVSIFKDR
ncbi:MAG: hypothetical protein Q4D90_10020 [bacterium]|nr:hypothetical protein [bacterium]